ncbi:hypothetical protein GCM10009069_02790 [Algimonas arctica]|uniref:Alkylphosphonate utilization protein n=1 Tax=Algimonas arctica TaxID=1479486 RepID=A0A8J3CQ30_9PROT|nr:zinc ribbon domain-containing protein YjdM [Algimonas arctica]GHA82976.1 hypothetical protein GCM10009069_02790 [Algimonas arctica]
MSELPPCPECACEYVYEDGPLLICPECAHEWAAADSAAKVYRDANGNELQDGDMVTLIKDLKVKGTSKTVKVGTKVRINRLVDEDHDIDCKIDGIGAMKLKTEFVKKA